MKTERTAPMACAEHRDASLALVARIAATLNAIPTENAHWGNVGTMDNYRRVLQELSDRMHNEGAFAPEPATRTTIWQTIEAVGP